MPPGYLRCYPPEAADRDVPSALAKHPRPAQQPLLPLRLAGCQWRGTRNDHFLSTAAAAPGDSESDPNPRMPGPPSPGPRFPAEPGIRMSGNQGSLAGMIRDFGLSVASTEKLTTLEARRIY
jgi:hypothetical protein